MNEEKWNVEYTAAGGSGARLVPAVIAALVAAMVGAAVWAAVAIITEYELGILAWGIGLITGAAGAAVARQPSSAVGVGSALAAAAGLVVAKVVIVMYVLSSISSSTMLSQDDLRFYAASHHLRQTDGFSSEVKSWLEDEDGADTAKEEARLEALHRHEVETALTQLSEQELDAAKSAFTTTVDRQMGSLATDPAKVWEGLKGSFSPWDFLWFGLALFTAFRVGKSGLSA